MANNVYKIEIRLRKNGTKSFNVSTRTDSGRVMRSSGDFLDQTGLAGSLDAHNAWVADPEASQQPRAHALAVAAAKAQVVK